MKSSFSTRNAAGKNFDVTFAPIGNEEWSVTITESETQKQDHGTFKKLENGLFGIEGLMDDEFGFDTDDVVMIQNEIALDLKNHGELVFQESI